MSNRMLPSNSQVACHDLTLTATANAIADGCDTNCAIARLSYQGLPLSGQTLSFTLSGDALFSNGAQQLSAATDQLGEATVLFTDTRPETVLITCNYNELQSWDSASFVISPLAGVAISVAVLQNNAPADGVSRNGLRYRVSSLPEGAPVPGAALDVSVTGGALLIPPAGPWVTDGNGLYDLFVAKNEPGQVLVSAEVSGAPEAENHTFLNFVPPPVPVYVLSYTVTRGSAPADGTRNTIVFHLTRDGVGVANRALSYSASPATAQLVVTNPLTNAAGFNTLNLFSYYAGSVTITASVPSIPEVAPVQVTVIFTPVARRYFIANEVIRDREPAGGAPNQVRFTVFSLADFTPQQGVHLAFSVSPSGRLSNATGTTLSNGTFTLDIFNDVAESVRVTATIATEPLTDSNVDISFT
ncbi:Ig-like domain-containing protein [Acerihabitans sp. KWT182]|uniref:Ig-like domain-containing protein n=1 Tax=Acerihabitans sp. KWT182 TaxID=3157919 RepID=A0AAU7QB35_9GAMM